MKTNTTVLLSLDEVNEIIAVHLKGKGFIVQYKDNKPRIDWRIKDMGNAEYIVTVENDVLKL